MARARQGKKSSSRGRGGDRPEPGSGGWKAARTWVAGVASAVLIAAVGVVFTAWYTASGSDAIDRIGNQPPVTVGHVEVELDERPLVLREPVTDPRDRAILLGKAVSDADVAAMLARHHVATIGDMTATVVLTGNRSSVRIIDIEPRVLTRAAPSDGAYLVPGTAGETGTVELIADLDRRPVRFATKEDPRTAYFTKKQIDLKHDEVVTLSLSIVGAKAYYEFDLVATVLAGDRSEKIVINGPGGVPFRLTGRAGSYRTAYSRTGSGFWVPEPSGRACTAAEKC
ncbi:hypothetical protein ACFOY2_53140 [Nonomuraea purpurea]|uniref:FtsQ-type POTRA domain-containing protein n=1 Tax=Nonomuraea purpurea TaxID=1849276 RepID=A0ABV8GQS7_9ACTN